MTIEIEELLEIIKGYGTDSQPVTIGLLKNILIDLKNKKESEDDFAEEDFDVEWDD